MTTGELRVKPDDWPRRSWLGRLFGHRIAHRTFTRRDRKAPRDDSAVADIDESQGMARRMIAEDRYVFVLLNEAAQDIDNLDAQVAWEALSEQMALVPRGTVPVVRNDGRSELCNVPAFYIDRYAVTNRQYQRFLRAGGYDRLEIWPPEVWPSLMRFVDRTGRPGPLDWERGTYTAGKGSHPVVGICWYEALAYARWVGKRLLTAAEWQKAGGWPDHLSGGICNRFPWGDVFDPSRMNLWVSGLGQTVSVRDFSNGSTLNGIYQMTGNVWEWLDDPLDSIPCQTGETFHSAKPLRRIIGGAYNTYLSGEVTCHFVTGQPELDRRENIGFRCAVSIDRLRPGP